jgi:hypothetical protein
MSQNALPTMLYRTCWTAGLACEHWPTTDTRDEWVDAFAGLSPVVSGVDGTSDASAKRYDAKCGL